MGLTGMWDNLSMIRQEYSKANLTERIAWYTIESLKKLGYDCELVKPTKKPKTWKVLPKNRSEMNRSDLEKFELLKKETVDGIKKDERQALKELGKSLTGN